MIASSVDGTTNPVGVLDGRFRHALVVEDNPMLCRSLLRVVGSWGTAAVSAGTLKDALALLGSTIDLVVSDIRLPDGDGRAVFERALQLDPVPVMVAMSGRATTLEAFELGRLGVHRFVEKPFVTAELESEVIEAAAQHQRAELPGGPAATVARRAIAKQVARAAAMYRLSDQQTEVLRLLLSGVSRKQLPVALGISENTCKTLIRRLLVRCDATRITDVMREIMGRSTIDG